MDRPRLTRYLESRLADLPAVSPLFLSANATVQDAVNAMRDDRLTCVLTGAADDLQGIFTERDVLTKCMGEGFDWSQPLKNVATGRPRTIASTSTVADAIGIMHQYRYRTIPIVEGHRVLGLVRLGDLLKQFAEAFPEELLNLPPRPHQVASEREGG